jgi:hypothetical protein
MKFPFRDFWSGLIAKSGDFTYLYVTKLIDR